jgi:sugar/nucleoside kinase (ribokinase family)
VIVVVGSPVVPAETLRPARRASGLPVAIALSAHAAGARVEVVGKVGDDTEGDEIAVELEREGVGHAALARDPVSATPREAAVGVAGLPLATADVDLALRYLTDATVIVSVWADAVVAGAIADAARYAGAHLVVVERGGDGPSAEVAGEAATDAEDATTRFRAPAEGDGAIAEVVGRYAAALDRGEEPKKAFRAATDEIGWEPADG